MARIRSIKPEFWSSEQIMECSPNARLLFIGLWNFCDDLGRHPFALKQIKALVFPGDDFTSEAIANLLGELEKNLLIETYEVDGKRYLQVTGWHHQKIDKPQGARFPGKNSKSDREPVADHSPNGIDGREGIRDRIGKDQDSEKQARLPAPSPARVAKPNGAGGQAGLSDDFRGKIVAAVGTEPCANDPDFGPIKVLLAEGCSEADVLGGIAVALEKTTDRIRHWSAFAGWAIRVRDDRLAGERKRPAKTSAAPPLDPESGPKIDLVNGVRISAAKIREMHEAGQWFPVTMGPRRGEKGCLVPEWVFEGAAGPPKTSALNGGAHA